MSARPRILMTAFSCNPEKGSEPGVGHFFVSSLARHCDLTVITEEVENRDAIERRRQIDPVYAAIDFHYIKWPWLDASGRRIDDSNAFSYYRTLRQWEQSAFELARDLLARGRFDLTHHLTMQGYREPGYLWRLPLPFVWGPVGGHASMPWSYFPMLGWRGWIQYGVRNIGNAVQARLHRRVRKAAQSAAAVVVNTSAERDAFQRHYGVDAAVIAEFGAESADTPVRRRRSNQPLKIVWSGVHVPRKGLPILLRAVAMLPSDVAVELHILGDGPERARWQSLAENVGVADRCMWHGRLPRERAIETMASCDLFALTSLLDGTSCVLNEAISVGLPVICHAACGFVDVVNDSCGVLVPLRSPSHSAGAFANAIIALCRDEKLFERLAEGARRRSGQISAASRAHQMLGVYESVLRRAASGVPEPTPSPKFALT